MAEQGPNGAGHVIVIDRQTADLAIPTTVRLGLLADRADAALSGADQTGVKGVDPASETGTPKQSEAPEK